MRYTTFIIMLILIGVAGYAELYDGQLLNGFNLSNSIIPPKEIIRGGPPKDGIPTVDEPNFLIHSEKTRLQDNHQVLDVFYNGIAKAYPFVELAYKDGTVILMTVSAILKCQFRIFPNIILQ